MYICSASLTQWLFFVGLRYTTATFACAFINMTPMFTFVVALPFGYVINIIICYLAT